MALETGRKRQLSEGTHVLTVTEFLKRFCIGGALSPMEVDRHAYCEPFQDVCGWAKRMGATSIFIGGSFVTDKVCPADIDLLITFLTVTDIPRDTDNFLVDDAVFDIQFVSDDQPALRAAFIELLSTERNGVGHGIVQIKLDEQIPTYAHEPPSRELVEAVKGDYGHRHCIPLSGRCRGVIVPIHGVRTHAEWLHQFSLLATTAGWGVAPYVYGYKSAFTLVSERQKKRIVSGLREWLLFVSSRHKGSLSIVAHSLGSYIFGRYLEEAGGVGKNFDGVILCGSILDSNFRWVRQLEAGRVGMVLNMLAPADEWVKFMPKGRIAKMVLDRRFGRGGIDGFSDRHRDIRQVDSRLFTHSDVIMPDVIQGIWLPFLNLAKNAAERRKLIEQKRGRG